MYDGLLRVLATPLGIALTAAALAGTVLRIVVVLTALYADQRRQEAAFQVLRMRMDWLVDIVHGRRSGRGSPATPQRRSRPQTPRRSQSGTEVDEPASPCGGCTGERGGGECDKRAGSGAGRGVVVTVRDRDRPDRGADDEREDGGDHRDGQQGADDLFEVFGGRNTTEVGDDVDSAIGRGPALLLTGHWSTTGRPSDGEASALGAQVPPVSSEPSRSSG